MSTPILILVLSTSIIPQHHPQHLPAIIVVVFRSSFVPYSYRLSGLYRSSTGEIAVIDLSLDFAWSGLPMDGISALDFGALARAI